MGVLFMMPLWEDASQGWMQRMMLGIAQDLAAVVVNDTAGETSWRGEIPVVSLYPPAKPIRYFTRLFELFGLSLKTGAPKAESILRSTIRNLEITHILCQYGTFAVRFMNVWRDLDIPLFVHFHGYDATFDRRVSDQPQKLYYSDDYLADIKELSKIALFITSSEFTKSLLVDAGIAPERVMVKYCGVTVSGQGRTHQKTEKIQILHLGRLVDFKSPDLTIKAFEIAKSKGLDGDLIMAGDGPLKVSCELLRSRSPFKSSIHILGSVDTSDVQDLISDSDIFTQHNMIGEITRQSEGYGVSVVEAMASGLPVVSTRSGGVLETVVHGETGILNAPGNVEAQADAFLKLAKNPDLRQKMGDAGRVRVSAFFSQQQEADQLRKIMKLPVRAA